MYTVFVSCYACVRVRENVSTPEDLLPSARQPAHGLGSLRYSLAVTHPGTNRGGRCLTSLIETNVVPLRHTAYKRFSYKTFKTYQLIGSTAFLSEPTL